MSIRFVALLAVVAGSCLVPTSAEAGLFGCRSAASACGCDVAPSCEVACDPCARPRLLAGLRGRLAAKPCCDAAPSCCDAAPVCCEPAPVVCCAPAPVACCEPAPVVCCEPAPVVCCEPAPVVCCDAAPSCGCDAAPACGCDAAPTCCKKPGLLARLKSRLASRRSCASSCAPSCGCEAAPSCGCGCN